MTQKQKNADSNPDKPIQAAARRKSTPGVSKAAPPRIPKRTKAKVELVSENEVRQKAYSLWESRGCPVGSPEVDWYGATEQLGTGKAI